MVGLRYTTYADIIMVVRKQEWQSEAARKSQSSEGTQKYNIKVGLIMLATEDNHKTAR